MPILAGRRAFYAALAVPIAMVIAPLTAAADVGEFSPGPDWYWSNDVDVAHSESEDTQVTYVLNGIYNDSVVGNSSEETTVFDDDGGFSPGPDWYWSDDLDVAHSESEDTQVTYVLNGIHDGTVIGNSSEETTVFEGDDSHGGFSPGPDGYGSDEVDVMHSDSEDTQVTYVLNGIYDDSMVGNSSDETTVFEGDDSHDESAPEPGWHGSDEVDVMHSDSEDTQETYVLNGIHDDTVIGNSSEDYTHLGDGVDEYRTVDGNDEVNEEADIDADADGTATSFEELSVGAGADGAYVHSTESSAFDLD